MTKEIHKAVAPLRTKEDSLKKLDRYKATPVFSGPLPIFNKCPAVAHASLVTKMIREKSGKYGLNLGQFAVLLRSLKPSDNFGLPSLRTTFKQANLPFTIHNRNNPLHIDESKVHIMTVNNAKGLEFPHVIIPWIGKFNDIHFWINFVREEEEKIKNMTNRLFYVACSRAAESLAILEETDYPKSLLEVLDRDDWNFTESTA